MEKGKRKTVMKFLSYFKKEKFEPNLIDLVEYEKDLLYAKEHRERPYPARKIPHYGPNMRSWTESELQCMRDNRSAAKEIKKRVFSNVKENENNREK